MSLVDYYIPAISGAPLPVLGAVLVLLGCQAFHPARPLEAIFACLIIFGAIVGSWRGLAEATIEIWPTNLVGWFVGFTMLMTDIRGQQAQVDRALHSFLLIHVSFFFTQSFTYLLSGYYIDPLSWFTDEPSRYLTDYRTMSIALFSIRPTGLFSEPSNYAVHILPIALLYYIQDGRRSFLIAAALSSVVLTFSSWAFPAAAVSSVLFINGRGKNLLLVGMLAAFLATFSGWFFTRTFEAQYVSGSTAAELRWEFAEDVLGKVIGLWPGLGIGVRDVANLGDLTLNDSSVPVYFFHVFGAYALALMIAFFWMPSGWRNKVVLVVILSSKMTPTYPFFWFLINVITRHNHVPTAPESDVGDVRRQTKTGWLLANARPKK